MLFSKKEAPLSFASNKREGVALDITLLANRISS